MVPILISFPCWALFGSGLQVSRRAISQDFLDGSGQLSASIPTAFDDSWLTWAKSNPLLVLGMITPVFSIAAAALTGLLDLLEKTCACVW